MVYSARLLKPLWMNLQLFAEPAGAGAEGGEAQGTGEGQNGQASQAGEGEQRYTLEEVQKLIQSETRPRVTHPSFPLANARKLFQSFSLNSCRPSRT